MSESRVQDFIGKLRGIPGLTVYDGTVDEKPVFPYVLALCTDAGPSERSAAGRVLARRFFAQTTVVGLSAGSVRIMVANVRSVLDGARLGTAEGPQIQEVEIDQPILEDRDVTDPVTNLHPLYQPLQWHAIT